VSVLLPRPGPEVWGNFALCGRLDTQPDYSSDPHAKVTRNAADAGTGGPLAPNGLNLACVYILDPPPAQTCSIWLTESASPQAACYACLRHSRSRLVPMAVPPAELVCPALRQSAVSHAHDLVIIRPAPACRPIKYGFSQPGS
jgi:hypothetical protein